MRTGYTFTTFCFIFRTQQSLQCSSTLGVREDCLTLAHQDRIGWPTMHGIKTQSFDKLLFYWISSSFVVDRNWSIDIVIHTIKRNKITSRRAQKLVSPQLQQIAIPLLSRIASSFVVDRIWSNYIVILQQSIEASFNAQFDISFVSEYVQVSEGTINAMGCQSI